MFVRTAVGAVAAAALLALSGGAAYAATGDSVIEAAASHCAPRAHGQQSWEGFPFPQQRWTETFTNNSCKINVRARVICVDNFDGVHHTEYGGIVYGNGKSYYTCNALQHVDRGNGQYFNGIKWVNFSS